MKFIHISISILTVAVALFNFHVSLKIVDKDVIASKGRKANNSLQIVENYVVSSTRRSITTNDGYEVIFPDANIHPYNDFTPHLNVIWSRGWYNAVQLPKGVPMQYYNDKGRSDMATNIRLLEKYFKVDDVCKAEYVWVRGRDLPWFARSILPQLDCKISLITSDAPNDVPDGLVGSKNVLESDKILNWYAQDKASDIDKIKPIPLGIPIHYGFQGSPHSLHTVETMTQIRNNATTFEKRSREIFYDKGTMEGSPGRRSLERTKAFQQLGNCQNVKVNAKRGHPIDFWKTLSSHQFGVCVTGVGWDTFRIWEMLFFGVIPIVKSSPLDLLLIPAHVPVLIVKDWSEICDLSDEQYNEIENKYKGWIKNSHHWLKPSLWIPRDQELMDKLCKESPGCEL